MKQEYRIYVFDARNDIRNAYDFVGPDDLSALDKANLLRRSNPAEVWQATRLVARITKNGDAPEART